MPDTWNEVLKAMIAVDEALYARVPSLTNPPCTQCAGGFFARW